MPVIIRLCSDLVHEHSTQERFLMGTNVKMPFSQVPIGPCPSTRSWLCTRALNWALTYDHILGTQCLDTAPFCAGARVLVLSITSITKFVHLRWFPVRSAHFRQFVYNFCLVSCKMSQNVAFRIYLHGVNKISKFHVNSIIDAKLDASFFLISLDEKPP